MTARHAEPEVAPVDVALDARGLEICPYLLAEDRRSRRATAWRGHRCTAVSPASPLALDKQRRLCLRAEHRSCATFLAARGVGAATADGMVDLERVTRWSIVRTTPTVLDAGSPVSGILERLSGTAGQAALAGALVVALAAVAAGQTGLLGGPGGSETAASATPATTATPTTTETPQPTPTAAATVAPTPAATPPPTTGPTASPLATAATTYVVQRGDTLWAISIQFGTTVGALQELNGLGTSTRLVVGQVLKIP
jgi:LysM repeat protein